jgi:hypothetical protein
MKEDWEALLRAGVSLQAGTAFVFFGKICREHVAVSTLSGGLNLTPERRTHHHCGFSAMKKYFGGGQAEALAHASESIK